MRKKIFLLCSVLLVAIIIYDKYMKKQAPSLIIENVEALSQNEQTDHYWCCGNTDICAKGDKAVIKGKLSDKPCN